MVTIITRLSFLLSLCFSETPKISPRVDRPAEYKSPPPKKQNKKQSQQAQESELNIKRKDMTSEKGEPDKKSNPREGVKVEDLSCMSSKELAEHVERLRSTVRRLQETECSFVEEVEEGIDNNNRG